MQEEVLEKKRIETNKMNAVAEATEAKTRELTASELASQKAATQRKHELLEAERESRKQENEARLAAEAEINRIHQEEEDRARLEQEALTELYSLHGLSDGEKDLSFNENKADASELASFFHSACGGAGFGDLLVVSLYKGLPWERV